MAADDTVINSYVAVGDSFTEGLDDRYEDGSGYRGWADLVAAELAARSGNGLRYANLAVRGRLFRRVADEQVPAALSMRPDLVSFAAGGNDVLRRNVDLPALVERFDAVVADLRAAGAEVLVFRFADLSRRLPGGRWLAPRVTVLNRAVQDSADRHGARMIDLSGDRAFDNPMLWSVDRLHLSSAGHQRVAAHVLRVLEIEPEPGWLTAPQHQRMSWPRARVADARWATRHLAPWVHRRLTGRSSGDTVAPKRPTLTPYTRS